MKIDGGALRLPASDVANFLACGHLTRLDLLHARGQLHPPREFGTGFEDLVRRGEAHEKAVFDRFRADGWRVAEIGEAPEAEARRATLEAISGGADVVCQGVLGRIRQRMDPPGRGPGRAVASTTAPCSAGFCSRRGTLTAL